MNVPYGYGKDERSIGWIETWLLAHHHPEYVARLIAWLKSRNGQMGIGGGWRADGTQPNKPGFAPAGKSFHQNQKYSDGFVGATAVDLVHRNPGNVHRSPTWNEAIVQGSDEAWRWGLHCNVGTPGSRGSEPWHIQPVEIDGHASWRRNNSPCPAPDWPFPGRTTVQEGNEMSAVPAKRWFDTRAYGVPLKGGEPFDARLPPEYSGVAGVYTNITIVDPSDAGFLVAYGGTEVPDTSNVNFEGGRIAYNTALVNVVGDRVQFRLSDNVREAHVVVDIQGIGR
jgi:hypothetical protein